MMDATADDVRVGQRWLSPATGNVFRVTEARNGKFGVLREGNGWDAEHVYWWGPEAFSGAGMVRADRGREAGR